MNHKYQITIAWSQEDECYLAYLPDFADEIMSLCGLAVSLPLCGLAVCSLSVQPVTHGNTYQEALQNGLDVMEELILQFQAEGKSLPAVKLVSA